MTDNEHPNADDYRNRAERAEQALAELAEQLATERANADRLAEAAGDFIDCADNGHVDAGTDCNLRKALAAHNLLRIDG